MTMQEVREPTKESLTSLMKLQASAAEMGEMVAVTQVPHQLKLCGSKSSH